MNDKDKINLTDLNKQKKSFSPPKLKNPFKKQTGPNRDDAGKFATTSGGGGLKSIKKFNWKRATPLIAIVTLVGGFLVFQSFAAGPSVPGRVNCRAWGKANGVPEKFYTLGAKSNVSGYMHGSPWVEWAYQEIHSQFPTHTEKLFWIERAEALHQEFSGDLARQSCGITWAVYNEIKTVAPESISLQESDQASKGDDVLMSIYAKDIVQSGSLSNTYLMTSLSHGSEIAHTIARPQNTKITKQVPSDWPEQVIVCAVLYNWQQNSLDRTTVKLSAKISTMNVGDKTVILEDSTKLSGSQKPKHEVCSSPINTKRANRKTPKAPYLTAQMDMVSIAREIKGSKGKKGVQITRQYRWDTSPNLYTVRFEQWVIKKAE